jgi:hypothetical protein
LLRPRSGSSIALLESGYADPKTVSSEDERLTVKPIPGSILFWRNLLPNGQGDPMTLHAGLPLTNGIKVGLNIWSMTPGADQDNYARNPVLDGEIGENIY